MPNKKVQIGSGVFSSGTGGTCTVNVTTFDANTMAGTYTASI